MRGMTITAALEKEVVENVPKGALIDGSWVSSASGDWIGVESPGNRQVFASIPRGNAADVNHFAGVPPPAREPGSPLNVGFYGAIADWFDSQLIAGYGEQVTYVERGSKAFRIGLEEDDVILSLNDQRLTHRGAWQLAMREAVADGGVVTLKVRHARTGAIAIRQANLLND